MTELKQFENFGFAQFVAPRYGSFNGLVTVTLGVRGIYPFLKNMDILGYS